MNDQIIQKKNSYIYIIITLFFSINTTKTLAQNALYTLTFDSNWSQETHPYMGGDLPSNAHWSPLVGVLHTSDIQFFAFNELASQGVQNIAELGVADVFSEEVDQAIQAGMAQQYLELGALANSSLGTLETTSIEVSADYPLISVLSMIAPSPDWMIAIHDIALLDGNGDFIEEIVIPLFPYDAGTDSGIEYASPNEVTDPPTGITRLQSIFPFSSETVGTITLTLETVLSTTDITNNLFTVYPNPSEGLFSVRFRESVSNPNAIVYDMLGNTVRTYKNINNNQQLDLTTLSSGIYFIQLASEEGQQKIQKLIIR